MDQVSTIGLDIAKNVFWLVTAKNKPSPTETSSATRVAHVVAGRNMKRLTGSHRSA